MGGGDLNPMITVIVIFPLLLLCTGVRYQCLRMCLRSFFKGSQRFREMKAIGYKRLFGCKRPGLRLRVRITMRSKTIFKIIFRNPVPGNDTSTEYWTPVDLKKKKNYK